MKRIEVSLNLGAVARLLDFIKPLVKTLERETAFPAEMGATDRELEGVWREGLIRTQVEDCRALMALFDAEFLNSGQIVLTARCSDAILRAAAAIRLKLREYPLKRLPDQTISTSEVDVASLSDDERTAFEALLFLEQIQRVIIEHLGG